MEMSGLDNDNIEKLLEIGFDKVNNKLLKNVSKENRDIIDKLDIKKRFEIAEILIDINNDSGQIITYFDEKKKMINCIKGYKFNKLLEKLLDD